MDDAQLKIQKAGPEAVEKFKMFDEYSNKLCDYYVEGFKIFCKYMAKHHSDLDFSTLDMEAVGKEILADRPSVGNADDRVEDIVVTTEPLVDWSPSNPA